MTWFYQRRVSKIDMEKFLFEWLKSIIQLLPYLGWIHEPGLFIQHFNASHKIILIDVKKHEWIHV